MSKQPSGYLVATSIPYANGPAHLGHVLEFLYGDVLARFHRRRGDQVLFTTGTDEHGAKIANQAQALNQSPQELVDSVAGGFRQTLELFKISHDRFIRTTDADHQRRVQLVWRNLSHLIYQKKFQGYYCSGCEDFRVKSVVTANEGRCPDHNQDYQLLTETNYFLKIADYKPALTDLITANRIQFLPGHFRQEVLELLKTPAADDVSISRPRSRLSWGVPVPDDPDHVIYVWFDALLNYITVLGYPDGPDLDRFWPARVQIIGRDILRFHAIIWPVLLLALKLPVYHQLYVHGFMTVDGQKMGKSLGNSVDPAALVADFGLDGVRNYFLGQLPSHQDGDYSYQRLKANYNSQLVDSLGNLLWRLLALKDRYQIKIEADSPVAGRPDLEAVIGDHLKQCRFDQALGAIWAEIRFLNGYLETQAPWSEPDPGRRRSLILSTISSLRLTGRALEPFLPDTSRLIGRALDPAGSGLPGPPFSKRP